MAYPATVMDDCKGVRPARTEADTIAVSALGIVLPKDVSARCKVGKLIHDQNWLIKNFGRFQGISAYFHEAIVYMSRCARQKKSRAPPSAKFLKALSDTT